MASLRQAGGDRLWAAGEPHPVLLRARAAIAAAYHAAGKIADALALSEQVCADYERVLGPAHPDTLARSADLARAYRDAGRLADAATLLRDTLARCEQALAPGHPLTQALRDTMTGVTTG